MFMELEDEKSPSCHPNIISLLLLQYKVLMCVGVCVWSTPSQPSS